MTKGRPLLITACSTSYLAERYRPRGLWAPTEETRPKTGLLGSVTSRSRSFIG